MYKKIMIPLILTIILTSCANQNMKDNPNSEAYTLYNSIFYHQYSNQLYLFSEILNGLAQEDTNQVELAYLKGKIEGYSKNSWFVFYSINRKDSPSLQRAVPAELRSTMYELIEQSNHILSLVSQNMDEDKKMMDASDNQKLILEIIQICEELNVSSSYIKDEKNINDYKEQLQLALIKIKELKSELEKE